MLSVLGDEEAGVRRGMQMELGRMQTYKWMSGDKRRWESPEQSALAGVQC